MRFLTSICAALALIVLALGCGGGDSGQQATTAPPAGGQRAIGISVLTLTNPFFMEMADHMRAEAEEHGFSVIVTSADSDVARQQNQVKDFIAQGVSAIVLCPADSRAIAPAIREANEAGIPVFTADIAALAPDAHVVSHIATDNYSGGRQAGEAMIGALGESGTVAILDHPEVESVLLRTRGFEEVLNEARESGRADIEIVAKLPGRGARDHSFSAMEDILQAHPGLDGVFAINDPSALGALAALERAGRQDEVVIIGFDGQKEAREAIRDGAIHADPIQFPDRIGRETIQAIIRHFSGEVVPPEILIETSLYTREDALTDPMLQ